MEPAEALELETRRRIYEYVERVPGAHMRDIQRSLGLAVGTLEYHLNYLTKLDILTTREDGRYTRYYVTHQMGRREKDVLAVLRQAVPRQVVAHLLLAPGMSHGEILAHFQISASTLSFHLKKLLTAGILSVQKDGRENRYSVLEPELASRVLITYKESFVDDVVDRFAEAWLELEPGAIPDVE